MLKVKPSPIELAIQLTTAVTNTMSDAEFDEFCRTNPDLNIERNAQGEAVVMAPAGANSGRRNAVISLELGLWARKDGRGLVFDSSSGFTLPNGAIRSPDAAWLLRHKWDALTEAQQERFAPVCPDFVLELRSRTDQLADLEEKMVEYIANGAQLGWLVDPLEKQVTVYRPEVEPEILVNPTAVQATAPLDGFVLPLDEIFNS